MEEQLITLVSLIFMVVFIIGMTKIGFAILDANKKSKQDD